MEPRLVHPMVPASEPRTRWRLMVGRAAEVAAQAQRDVEVAWGDAFARSGLPLGHGSDGRPRWVFGAPLPAGMTAERDLIDVVLTERWPRWRVREAIEATIPDGWTLSGLDDVWLGAPSLAGSVAAADYRIALTDDLAGAGLEDAIRQVMAATALPRERAKGAGSVTYDLRPLVIDISVVDAGPSPVILARARIHATLGNGRPDEIVGAIGDMLDRSLIVVGIVRERLVLAEDLA